MKTIELTHDLAERIVSLLAHLEWHHADLDAGIACCELRCLIIPDAEPPEPAPDDADGYAGDRWEGTAARVKWIRWQAECGNLAELPNAWQEAAADDAELALMQDSEDTRHDRWQANVGTQFKSFARELLA